MSIWPKGTERVVVSVCLCSFLFLATQITWAVDITWIGGNVDWIDGGSNANWNPADEPDTDDTAIFNTANSVSLGNNNSILALTMLSGMDLFTDDFDLTVNGLVQVSDSNTNLIIGGSASALAADSITINNGANLELDGGTVTVDEESGNGLLDINAGGELVGHGTLNMTDAVAANTTLIVNDGFITAQRSPAVILGDPVVGTLTISSTDADARIDLDGTGGETGAVLVRRNQTLDINVQLADIFNGSIDMFQNSVLDVSTAWIMGSNATLDIDNGFIDVVFPNPDVPAGIATIKGASFSQNSGTITVLDTDGTLQFDAPFTLNGGTFTNNGTVIFNSSTSLAAAGGFSMAGSVPKLVVAANQTVTVNQTNFELDGTGSEQAVIQVESNGTLDINTGDYDLNAATNSFDGTITINRGQMDINTADAEFVMDGVLNMHSSAAITAGWAGEPLDIGNDSGSLDADFNVTGANLTRVLIGAQVDFNSDADVHVDAGGILSFSTPATVNFQTVNGGNNAEFTGEGTIEFNGDVNVLEAVTLNMTGGEVDLDGADSTGENLDIDAPLTINAATMASFGKANISGTNTLDINNSAGTGVLTVNLDDANAEWTLNAQGVMNLVNDNTEATLLAGSDVNINGTVNVTGDVQMTARIDLGSTSVVNINTAGQPLRLAGGSTGDPNMLLGGTISGVGTLGIANTALHGFGTINTAISSEGATRLFADNGTLTINGSILSVGRIGTDDVDGVLNVVNPWNTNVASFVTLDGGTIQGGTMTIDNVNAVSGFGTITSRVINNTGIRASGGTLVVETAGNDNDWDGAANNASLHAQSNSTLELRDNLTFGFAGTVSMFPGGKVFANGFALDFNSGSSLFLNSDAMYESNRSTDLGGVVTTSAGLPSTIKIQNNFFLTFESTSATTLDADLRLENNNIIVKDNATFSGTGAIIVPDGSHMVAENGVEMNVLLDMQGAFRPGNSQGIARVDMLDFQTAPTSELYFEFVGTSLNAYDRLVVNGTAIVDGFLSLDIDDISPGVPFVPVLGNTFNIITATSVVGTFDTVDVSGMPAGLAFHVEYLANAVQLQVVTKPIFSADFDDDGDVDSTDLGIWQNAYNLNQLGDADGDNDSDGRDFLMWQRQHGSAPLTDLAATNTAVPEPSAAMLVLTVSGIFTIRRKIR